MLDAESRPHEDREEVIRRDRDGIPHADLIRRKNKETSTVGRFTVA